MSENTWFLLWIVLGLSMAGLVMIPRWTHRQDDLIVAAGSVLFASGSIMVAGVIFKLWAGLSR